MTRSPFGAQFPLVCLGISTGGPKTLRALFQGLPRLPIAIALVQHMPKFINEGMARSVSEVCAMDAEIVQEGQVLRAGCVHIAPSELHCELVDNHHFTLHDGPLVCFVKPSVDVLMRSVRAEPKRRLLSVVMTGMGRDGAEGLRHMKGIGALTVAQDRATSVVYGMPRAAYATGCVDHVLSVKRIRDLLIRAGKP